MTTTVIQHARYVMTVDSDRRVIEDGAVAIENGRISAVGKTAEIASKYRPDETIDARGKLVMPGMFDTHVQGIYQLGRGLADQTYSTEYFFARQWPLEAKIDADDALCAFRLSQLELLRAGITSFADPGSFFPEQQVRALEESGMRGVVARPMMDTRETPIGSAPEVFAETADTAFARGKEAVTAFNNAAGGRVKAWFSMRLPLGCSDELLKRVAKAAGELGVGIMGPAAVTREQVMSSYMKFNAPEIVRLENIGVLGPNLLLGHMGWVNMDEMLLLKKRDVKVAICPNSSFHHALGSIKHGKVPELIGLGVTLSLGSGSAMSSNYLDGIRQTFVLIGGFHEARLDPRVIRPESAIEMLTIGGARATGWDADVGSLEVGKKADVTILDMKRPEWQPIHNPIANFVYCAHGGCVDTVLVDGKVLVRGGKVLSLNADDLYREAKDRARSLAKRSGLEAAGASSWPRS